MFEEASFDDDFGDNNVTTVTTNSVSNRPLLASQSLATTTVTSPSRDPPTTPASPVRINKQSSSTSGAMISSSSLAQGSNSSSGGLGKGARTERPQQSSSSSAATPLPKDRRDGPTSQAAMEQRRARHQQLLAATRLHKAGDDGYRFTCVPPTTATAAARGKHGKGGTAGGGGGGRYDDNFASGDAWGSSVCHCMICEMHTVFSLVQQHDESCVKTVPVKGSNAKTKQQSATEQQQQQLAGAAAASVVSVPPTVILWDMDNFGFNHMKADAGRVIKHTHTSYYGEGDEDTAAASGLGSSPTPSSHSAAAAAGRGKQRTTIGAKRDQRSEEGSSLKVQQFAQNTIFWFFYGSCFARRHDTTPKDHVEGLRDDDASLWATLAKHSTLVFTPCAGHSQAADEVMMAIALGIFPSEAPQPSSASACSDITPPFPTILVTRDKELRETVQRLAGVEHNTITSSSSSAAHQQQQQRQRVKAVRCVDPLATGGTFVPFWGDLTTQVEAARKEYAAVKLGGGAAAY